MASLNDTIDDVCECPICNNWLQVPKSLPCLHTFCLHCLQQYCNSDSSELNCPICRKNFTLPAGGCEKLPTSFHLEKLLESRSQNLKPSNADVKLCELCMFEVAVDDSNGSRVCFFCKLNHPSPQPNVVDNDKQLKCNKHQKICEMYCQSCNEVVCVKCIIEKHNGEKHKCVEIEIAVNDKKVVLKAFTLPINNKLTTNQMLLNNLVDCKRQIRDNFEEMHFSTVQKVQQIKNFLDNLEVELSSNAAKDLEVNMDKLVSVENYLIKDKERMTSLRDRMVDYANLPTSSASLEKMNALQKCAVEIIARKDNNTGRIKTFKFNKSEEDDDKFTTDMEKALIHLIYYDRIYLRHHSINFEPKQKQIQRQPKQKIEKIEASIQLTPQQAKKKKVPTATLR